MDFQEQIKQISAMNVALADKVINIKVTFTPPVIYAKDRDVVFSRLGEELAIDNYKVKLVRIDKMPTSNEVGMAIVRTTSVFGKTDEQLCVVAKRRGGYRGGVRPHTGRTKALSVRVAPEVADMLEELTKNKSEYIEQLIKDAYEKK